MKMFVFVGPPWDMTAQCKYQTKEAGNTVNRYKRSLADIAVPKKNVKKKRFATVSQKNYTQGDP